MLNGNTNFTFLNTSFNIAVNTSGFNTNNTANTTIIENNKPQLKIINCLTKLGLHPFLDFIACANVNTNNVNK